MTARAIPFSTAVNNAMRHAENSANSLGHSHLGSGHLLVGLARSTNGSLASRAAQILKANGITPSTAEETLANLTGTGTRYSANIPHDHLVKEVLLAARKIATKARKEFIGTEEILEALLAQAAEKPDADASRIIERVSPVEPGSFRIPTLILGSEQPEGDFFRGTTSPAPGAALR